jgi:hypothetical protein
VYFEVRSYVETHFVYPYLQVPFRALIFAVALILGFAMFAKRKIDFEIEVAFAGARELLEMLSLRSAQAAHYFEILVLLSDVITEQRQKLASQTNRSRSGYVGRIFSLHNRRPNVEAGPGTNPNEISMVSPSAGSGIVGDTWMPKDNYTPHQSQPDLDGEGFLG